MSAVRILELAALDADAQARLLDRKIWNDGEVMERCRAIVEQVRDQGDRGLIDLTRKFDGVELTPETLRVSRQEIDDAGDALDRQLREALDYAIGNIRKFHASQVPGEQTMMEVDTGVWCGERWTPVDAACLYVPRGRGAFSSVACMLAVPAKLAGVKRLIICTPPGPDGEVDAATLYAARRIGVDEIYRVGGAQAVAAVAFGTETIPACDKIVGPGNVWVSAARQLLARRIDPGPPAGPSESLIVSDGTADPDNVAWNLLIEAEHGENSCALMVTHDPAEAVQVASAAGRLLDRLTDQRRAYASEVLSSRGGILVTTSLEESCEFASRFAGEHVALMVSEPWAVLPLIRNAGEILLGEFPVMSLANYAMGINAVLPTGGCAKTASGVSVRDFMKSSSIGFVTRDGFETLRRVVPTLSADEGFSAHHLAVENWNLPGEPS